MTTFETRILVGVILTVLVAFLIAVHFDLRKQERERPSESFRGPYIVRYLKNLLASLGNGLMSLG